MRATVSAPDLGLPRTQGELNSAFHTTRHTASQITVSRGEPAHHATGTINSLHSSLSTTSQIPGENAKDILLEQCEKIQEQIERITDIPRLAGYSDGDKLKECIKTNEGAKQEYQKRATQNLEEIRECISAEGENPDALNECQDNLNKIAENLKAYKKLEARANAAWKAYKALFTAGSALTYFIMWRMPSPLFFMSLFFPILLFLGVIEAIVGKVSCEMIRTQTKFMTGK